MSYDVAGPEGDTHVPSYEIRAIDGAKTVRIVATVDTATAALMKLRDAHHDYRRAWAVGENGNEVSGDELLARSWEERNRT